ADSISKLNTYSDGMRVLRTIARLYKEYRPLSFFGLFAAMFALLGLLLFVPVLVEFFRTGLVPRYPTLIVSGVCATLSLMLLVCGVILDTVAKKHRQLFEVNLNLLRLLRKEDH
ncbi:MAG: glycosyl transferase, partial [Clostridia bacterium]